jgi:hypothetical protein
MSTGSPTPDGFDWSDLTGRDRDPAQKEFLRLYREAIDAIRAGESSQEVQRRLVAGGADPVDAMEIIALIMKDRAALQHSDESPRASDAGPLRCTYGGFGELHADRLRDHYNQFRKQRDKRRRAQRPTESSNPELAFDDAVRTVRATLNAHHQSQGRGLTVVALLLMLPFLAIVVFAGIGFLLYLAGILK